MAATTVTAILTRLETVLQAPPLGLTLSLTPFSDTTEPNVVMLTLVRVVSGGLVGQRCTSNYSEARMERLTVTVQQPLNFDGYGAQRDLTTLCDAIVRALIADGPAHGYDVTEERGSRKVTRPPKTDLCRAEIHVIADFDYSEV